MRRTVKVPLLLMLYSISVFVRAEAPAESSVPDFAVAKLSISQVGVFLDKNGALANQIIPNAGPLAKIALANLLFKLPVDESLNFEGSAQIYIVPPLTFTASQDVATVLPVSDAEKVKKNAASVYGDPTQKDGAMVFSVPQPIPFPDKMLFIKVTKDKALLAPSADVLKQLEAVVGAPAMKGADAELLISVPAVKKLFGQKVDDALQAGALLAAGGELDALKKLSDQIGTIQKTLWEISTIELRLKFDEGSKNIHAELAIAALKGSKLSEVLDNPPPGLEGKDTALLAANAPINAAIRMNGISVFNVMKNFGLEKEGGIAGDMERKLFELYTGETVLAVDIAKQFGLQTQHAPEGEMGSTRFETIFDAIIALINKKLAEDEGVGAPVLTASHESVEHKGVQIAMRKMDLVQGGKVVQKAVTGAYIAHGTVNGAFVVGASEKAEDAIKTLVDATQANIPVAPELKAAFDTPPPGTLVLVSAKLLELVRVAVVEMLPDAVPPEQIVGGLADSPVFGSVFMHAGKAGVRVTVPGAAIGSVYSVAGRLRRHGVSVLELLGFGGNKAEDAKVPGNVPPPPPPPRLK